MWPGTSTQPKDWFERRWNAIQTLQIASREASKGDRDFQVVLTNLEPVEGVYGPRLAACVRSLIVNGPHPPREW